MSTAAEQPAPVERRPGRSAAPLGLRAGLQLAGWRLNRRTTWLLAIAVAVSAAAIAWIERNSLPFDAASRALRATLSLLVPLACFALTLTAHGRARLDDSVWPLARHGLPRRYLVMGSTAGAMIAGAALSLLACELALAAAYGTSGALARDAVITAPIAVATGAAYAAWFSVGSALGRRGGGVWIPLLADFTLGSGQGGLAVWWPRAHAVSLAGGEPVLALTQRQSSVVLWTMALVLAGLAAYLSGER